MAAVGREAAMGPCRDEGFERAADGGLHQDVRENGVKETKWQA